jgi:hypothetical protein
MKTIERWLAGPVLPLLLGLVLSFVLAACNNNGGAPAY